MNLKMHSGLESKSMKNGLKDKQDIREQDLDGRILGNFRTVN